MKVQMLKKLGGLAPVDDAGAALMRRLGLGELVSVEVKRPRNGAFHRKYFAMMNLIYHNQEHYKSLDDLVTVCKLRTGHCHTVSTKQGDVQIPDSISFAAMDEDSFAEFYDRVMAWVVDEVIPGLERTGLDEAVATELREFGAPEG